MSTTPAKRPNLNRRSFIQSPSSPARSPTPSRETTPTATTNGSTPNGTGIGRRHTIREGPNGTPYVNGHASHPSISSLRNGVSARSQVKRPSISGGIDDAELEKDIIIADLRQKVSKLEATAETATEEFTTNMKAMQQRMEEAIEDAAKMEEQLHMKADALEDLEIQVKDLSRAKRDQENIHDAERLAWSQEKEDMLDKEEELNATIQRLKDALAQAQREKSIDETSSGRRSSGESQQAEDGQFAPANSSSSAGPSQSMNNLLLQKDKIIQQLRLELAEYQIRVAEADHMGGSKVQELEQRLMEVRMANARLMEDNESFQLLLSTATLNGDFSRGDFMTNAFSDGPETGDRENETERPKQRKDRKPVSSSLADELDEAEENEAQEDEEEEKRKMEAELKALRDQNKALTLYINNIIERLLQHKDFETILDKTPSLGSIQADQAKQDADKSSKAPPPPPAAEKPSGINILNRTRSLASKGPSGGRAINKPMPAIPKTEQEPQPLQRSQSMRVVPTGLRHKRSQSDTGAAYTNGANVVNTMQHKGPPRASTFFSSGSGDNYTSRPPRSRNSVASSASITSSISDSYTADTSLPSPTTGGGPIGMIAGNKLRPLRLVQENVGGGIKSPISPAEETEKKSKRASWIGGWFNRGKEEEPPANQIVFERKDIE